MIDLLDLPEEGRDQLLEREQLQRALADEAETDTGGLLIMGELLGWLTETCTRDRMVPGGFATTIHEAGGTRRDPGGSGSASYCWISIGENLLTRLQAPPRGCRRSRIVAPS